MWRLGVALLGPLLLAGCFGEIHRLEPQADRCLHVEGTKVPSAAGSSTLTFVGDLPAPLLFRLQASGPGPGLMRSLNVGVTGWMTDGTAETREFLYNQTHRDMDVQVFSGGWSDALRDGNIVFGLARVPNASLPSPRLPRTADLEVRVETPGVCSVAGNLTGPRLERVENLAAEPVANGTGVIVVLTTFDRWGNVHFTGSPHVDAEPGLPKASGYRFDPQGLRYFVPRDDQNEAPLHYREAGYQVPPSEFLVQLRSLATHAAAAFASEDGVLVPNDLPSEHGPYVYHLTVVRQSKFGCLTPDGPLPCPR